MAAPSKKEGATGTSLISRTMERCKSGLMNRRIGAAGAGRPPRPGVAAGCFPVYVGPERVRFVVRVEDAAHPLFRVLLDDAQREYGYGHAARGIALPCEVDAYLDVLWRMEHGDGDDGDGGKIPAVVVVSSPPPIRGLRGFSKGRAAIHRMMNPRGRLRWLLAGEHKQANN